MKREHRTCLLMMGLVLVLWAAPVRAQEMEEEIGPDGAGKVILDWDTFRALTEHEREAAEPELVLPWQEVQDLLGIEVEGADGAELTLDWRQFKALLEWSITQKKPEPPVDIPADYVIASSDYTGTLRPEGAVFKLKTAIDVLKEKGWKRIPLLPATVAIEKAELPQGCHLNIAGGRYELLTAGTGRIELSLSFAAAVAERAGAHQVQFDTVPSGTCTLKLMVPQEKVTVNVAGAQAVLPLESGEGETVVGASLASGTPVQISWERALEAIEKVPPKLYAETATLVAVGEGILTCRERVSLSVLHTGIRSVLLGLPEEVSVLEASGPAVRDWHASDGKLEVRFAHEVIGSTVLNLTFERAAKAGAEEPAQAPVLRVQEAVREKGFIAVVALANVEISAPEHPGATSVDVRQLPPELLQMTGQPVLLAFRYVGEEFQIPLLVQKHEDVKVLLTIVDSGLLTVMQTMDGKRITKAIYNVRNNRSQFIRMELPEDAELWSATVAGRSVRPALDDGGRLLIPLVRSASAQVQFSSFPVELVYVEKQERVTESGEMKVDLPRMAVPITHVMLQLYLPAEGSYKKGVFGGLSFEGPLRTVDAFSHLASVPAPAQMRGEAAQQAEQLQQAFSRRIEQEAVASGVTPIRVELPVRGQMFRFEKILALDEPLWVSFRYSGWENE